MRQECCHTFNLSSGVPISICSFCVRACVTGSYSHSLTKPIQHHHCIYLAHTYYLCCTGVNSLKGEVNRRKCMFPPDVPQYYSLSVILQPIHQHPMMCCSLSIGICCSRTVEPTAGRPGSDVYLGVQHCSQVAPACLPLHGKRGIRRKLLGAQGLLQYGVGKLGGLCLSEVTLGVVCQCSSNSR